MYLQNYFFYDTIQIVNDIIRILERSIIYEQIKKINSDGDNVTDSFIINYEEAYQKEDFKSILCGCYQDGISQMDGHNYILPDRHTRSVIHPKYEESKVHLITQNGFPYNEKNWYLVVTATGSYGLQDATNEIIAFPSPSISVSFSELGALFSGSLDSIRTTQPVISSNRKSVSFNVTTTHTVSCPIPGVSYVTGTLGPFTNTSYFVIKP